MPLSQPQSQTTTFEQQVNIGLLLANLIAVSVMVLLRGHIGWRTLSVGSVLMMLALFCVANPMQEGAFSAAKASDDPFPYRTALPPDKFSRPGWLGVFGVVSFFAAGRQKHLRWLDIRNGVAWHTYHRGISRLSFLPVEPSTLARIVEPAVCIVGGVICWHWLSVALGLWLIFAGLALRVVEQWIYKRNLQRTLDLVDATIESRNLSDLVERFEQPPAAKVFDNDDVEVVHARLSPDVEALIARRKRSSAKKTANAFPPQKNAQITKPILTARQRFWRFFWGRHVWKWWEHRHGR